MIPLDSAVMSTRMSFRVAALLGGAFCIVAAIEAWVVGLESASITANGAAAAGLAAGGWLGLSAFIPTLISWPLERLGITRWWRRLQTEETQEAASGSRGGLSRLASTLMIGGGVLFAANVYWQALSPLPVDLDDQGAYLATAEEVRADQGLFITLPRLYADLRAGRFREANRHPLFIGLLAVRPTEAWGRHLAWTFGIALFITGVWMVWRRFSALTAGFFAILLGLNHNLGQFSVMVVCETLLMWMVSLAFFALLPPAGASRSLGRRRFRILMAAAWLGFAFLTKGTGLLFYGVFLLWLAWQARPRRDDEIPAEVEENAVISVIEAYPLRQWAIAKICGLIGFAVVASPLIERNIRVFGNPFHNVNSLLLFTDDYSQFDNLLNGGVTTEEAAEQFFRTHTIEQMVVRELRGLVWEAFIMLRMLGPMGLEDGRVIFGVPIAMCCAVGLWFERRPAKWLLVGWLLASWFMFAWYVPIAAGDRFPIPLLAPVLAYAADGIRRLLASSRRILPETKAETA